MSERYKHFVAITLLPLKSGKMLTSTKKITSKSHHVSIAQWNKSEAMRDGRLWGKEFDNGGRFFVLVLVSYLQWHTIGESKVLMVVAFVDINLIVVVDYDANNLLVMLAFDTSKLLVIEAYFCL